MKALLILCVLLVGVLAVTAEEVVEQKVGAFVPETFSAEEVASSPQEEQPEKVSGGKVASSARGFFIECPSGWVSHKYSCYQYSSSKVSWSSALANCASQGASLVSVQNVFDYSFLQELTKRSGGTNAWMGGFYFQDWRWVDQSHYSYSYWSSLNSATSYPCIYLKTTSLRGCISS
ncbi:killer cell lectin-like receptor subfamily B member 1B allele A [Embiotoca jacksoni]|uniref:killer cell lectin-like receptor subfamily B member 1B allele A n=1 Tax=Embiotoca jacksoni TaxID=100190 RepID=UPI0037047569